MTYLMFISNRNLLWKACEHQSENKEDYTTISSPQSAGCLYLSYPCAMLHSPLYPRCDWSSRVIAVQARCLLTQQDLERYAEICTPEIPKIMNLVYEAIQNGFVVEENQQERIRFVPPSLEEILAVQDELRPLWVKEKRKISCSCS